jgi:predicted nucleic acid-binding protein
VAIVVKVAQELGLTVIGVLGILAEGKRLHFVSEIRPALERLRRELDFHLTPALIAEFLRQANE